MLEANSSDHLSSKETSITVTNLEDDTTYNFTVAASTRVGVGPYTLHVTAKTRNFGEIT